MEILEFLRKPWPWYVAGPLIGLTVPLLILLGEKSFGISSTLRHICAATFPGKVKFLQHDWRKESWNLFFAGGIVAGGFLAGWLLANPLPADISPATVQRLEELGVSRQSGLVPREIYSWGNLLTLPGFLMIVGGGFLVGFGTRYAGGCTSGHGITGLSNLQWPSLVAVVAFFAGGIVSAWFILPILLSL